MKMQYNPALKLLLAASSLFAASSAHAVIIDFTGGSVSNAYANHYEENGFQIDVIGDSGAYFGDYYSAANDVIHAHWGTGDFGSVVEIIISKIGGGTFDLNYFILTSNTDTGGGAASGAEKAFIKNNNGHDMLLPVEDWGFPATQIYMGAEYDNITSFSFYVNDAVDCFGMDEFYIDEEAPPPPGVPDSGSSILLLGLGLIGLVGGRRIFR